MIPDLATLIAQSTTLQSKVIILTGGSLLKDSLLQEFASHSGHPIVSVGAELSPRLVSVEKARRSLEAARIFRELVEGRAAGGVLLLRCLEVLFDQTLNLNPLLLLRQNAKGNTLVASWPGVLRNGRLQYAAAGHPEYRDYEPIGVRLAEAIRR